MVQWEKILAIKSENPEFNPAGPTRRMEKIYSREFPSDLSTCRLTYMGTCFLYVNISVFLIKEHNFVKHSSSV